jgi:3D-(3,5/4)-trihydroxycyclohexane-1,2-dione acylhydrolase (decyclizing)
LFIKNDFVVIYFTIILCVGWVYNNIYNMQGKTIKLTVGQAIVKFLTNQYSSIDGIEQRLIEAAVGIFGHGNVCGLGQGLLENSLCEKLPYSKLKYIMNRNEQGAVHMASGFAKSKKRLSTLCALSSIGPGATNMITGAALATTNRLPVLIFPSDTFSTRVSEPVLQQLENESNGDMSVNDAFKPVSKYWDRINRPEQLIPSLLNAMRVLTDPANTGAVTICLPEDVQAEAFEFPVEFFKKRIWYVQRPKPDELALKNAVSLIKNSKRPLIISGGGTVYSFADNKLREFANLTGIPVADTQSGKGAINWNNPQSVGGVGATGSLSANKLAEKSDLIIGIGTRYSDFTTASKTQFKNPNVKFININIAAFDSNKQSALSITADAKQTLIKLIKKLKDYTISSDYKKEVALYKAKWDKMVDGYYNMNNKPIPSQLEVFGALNELLSDNDILINAAGSMPGDLQSCYRAKNSKSYHVEYAYSCMGYEIPASMGVKMANPESEVVAIVGDGTYQMLPMELATIVQEGIKVIFVLLDNGGFASIGALSQSHGSERFGTQYTADKTKVGNSPKWVPIDIVKNVESYGVDVIKVNSIKDFKTAYKKATKNDKATMLYIKTDIMGPNPESISWWDVPVAEISKLKSTQKALKQYKIDKKLQKHYL